jgi:hypothetical protein
LKAAGVRFAKKIVPPSFARARQLFYMLWNAPQRNIISIFANNLL